MNRLLPPLLLTGVLMVMAAAEIASGEPALPPSLPHLTLHAAATPALRALDTRRLGDEIVARPLFSSTRRPAAEASKSSAGSAPPRLSAILVGSQARRAVFDDGGHSLVALEGGRAGPYLVRSIAADHVDVLGPEGPRTLRPTPIPSGSEEEASNETAPPQGLSLLQQLQRGQVPHYAVPPPASIQSLIARMRNNR